MDGRVNIDRHLRTLKSLLAIILVWTGLADDSAHAAQLNTERCRAACSGRCVG